MDFCLSTTPLSVVVVVVVELVTGAGAGTVSTTVAGAGAGTVSTTAGAGAVSTVLWYEHAETNPHTAIAAGTIAIRK